MFTSVQLAGLSWNRKFFCKAYLIIKWNVDRVCETKTPCNMYIYWLKRICVLLKLSIYLSSFVLSLSHFLHICFSASQLLEGVQLSLTPSMTTGNSSLFHFFPVISFILSLCFSLYPLNTISVSYEVNNVSGRYALATLDSTLEGGADDMAVVDATSLRRQVLFGC